LSRSIHKSTRAEQDLIGIWRYTAEHWGDAQADRYLDDLDHAINALAENPELGISRDAVRTGYRAIFIKNHVAYYTVRPDNIYIVRVLHEKMDPDRHL